MSFSRVLQCGILLSILMAKMAVAELSFVLKDIEIEGVQRLSTETILDYIKLENRDKVNEKVINDAMSTLYKTGFFKDIKVGVKEDVLIILVEERPAISEIKIEGNEDIPTDKILEGFSRVGLKTGEIFNPSLLDQIKQEIQRQYHNNGKYGVSLTSTTAINDANTIEISIDINEGKGATIAGINIIGNAAFSNEELLDELKLAAEIYLFTFGKSDSYAKQKLAADLEGLRTFYLNRGYINFSIDSTQVTITPDKKNIFITINVTEGERYIVSKVDLAGELDVDKGELISLIQLKEGQVFSRTPINNTIDAISEYLGAKGYAFSNVRTLPKINEEEKSVEITFFVEQGKRMMVHRINIEGNTKTEDQVVRRELRQLEGTWLSTEKVKRSRVRLQRLGYFENINIETPLVEDTDNQVDLNVSVKERASGQFIAGMGYSPEQGFLFNASVSQSNFMGTGKFVSVNVNNSDVNTIYSFSYTNPYYTPDGVSRGFKLFLKNTDAGEANIADYISDVEGGEVNYGFPLSEYTSARLVIGYEGTQLKTTSVSPQNIFDFIAENKAQYDLYRVTAGWSYDSRNRAFFVENGMYHSVSAEVIMPGSGLEFYKVSFANQWYKDLSEKLVLAARLQYAYGDSYGKTSELPFFERFYTGGVRSVRGFDLNSLGPQSVDKQPIGGTLKTVGTFEAVFTPPFMDKNNSFRMSLFYDMGNVFESVDDFAGDELRMSVGVSAIWMSPLGPLNISYAEPINNQADDFIRKTQFSIGTFF